jgi:regulator of protease activity HflC (stomatin/prohibitin superfamily)
MGWTSFLVMPVALCVMVSFRVLKQYERGVVFLLGRFAGVHDRG